jgi:hypothetical protein
MARKRGGMVNVNMTSFMDIITGTVGSILMIMLSMILCATENPIKDIIIKAKQIEQGEREKQAKYIETTYEGITIYPSGKKISLAGLEDPDSDFMKLLKRINPDNEYIIFAIRPDGYKSFQKARDIAEKNEVEVGYEPINSLWNLKVEEDA